jgi:anthranilate synthase component 2
MSKSKVVVIDNYDSFTFNVVQYLEELGAATQVIKNDELSLTELASLKPQALVISPGPGSPDCAGISLSAIEHFSSRIPILGICLGHQAIGQVFGAVVRQYDRPKHGKTSEIRHSGGVLFRDLPALFSVTRYHSLVLDNLSIPSNLKVDAWVNESSDLALGSHMVNEVMAISHTHLPVHGVQFHPESILSEHGHKLLNNFLTHYRLV